MDTIIRVENLTKQYKKSKKPAVDHIGFEVAKGEFFAFLGPNGAGKTTTISILTTILSKTSGRVHIAGYDLDTQPTGIRKEIGIIFQKPSLDLDLSAEENIRLHACMYGQYMYRPFYKWMPVSYQRKVTELAAIMGIEDKLWKPLRTFSGGMQRKIEIMRSLVHSPSVLFLDEPTQGLDALSRRALWEYINEVRLENETTVFLTTHYIDEAETVDRVSMISEGRISFIGTPETMKNQLLGKELILDADNRKMLVHELKCLGFEPREGQHISIFFDAATPMEILTHLTTDLTVMQVREPSLEDAYISLIEGGRI